MLKVQESKPQDIERTTEDDKILFCLYIYTDNQDMAILLFSVL